LERVLAGLPASAAAELFVLGRRLEPQRAYALGVLTEIVSREDLERTVLDAAAEVLAQAPAAVSANARALRELRAGASPEVREGLAATRRAGMRSASFAEGVAAFRARREPDWR
jgi:enoyl-CoA hydratase/carnithine racemase